VKYKKQMEFKKTEPVKPNGFLALVAIFAVLFSLAIFIVIVRLVYFALCERKMARLFELQGVDRRPSGYRRYATT
jgi:hypothetical protein